MSFKNIRGKLNPNWSTSVPVYNLIKKHIDELCKPNSAVGSFFLRVGTKVQFNGAILKTHASRWSEIALEIYFS